MTEIRKREYRKDPKPWRYHTLESILAKTEKVGDCLEWLGTLAGGGYPQISSKGKTYRGNRLVWSMVNGPIPRGLFILHSCDNRKCINPQHLRAGTHTENVHDMYKRKRHPSQHVTHCQKGHEYNSENTYITKVGRRACRACKRNWFRKKYGAKPRKFKLKKMDGVERAIKELEK